MDIIVQAFLSAVSWANLLPALFGVSVGIAIGALPGFSVTMGVAVLFPLTLVFPGTGGIMMLLGIYVGAVYGGSISAILLNTPGTPASMVTTMEGYPLTKRGEGDKALTLSTTASFIGGLTSALVLTFLSPLLAKFALNFSAPEYFMLAAFGLSVIISISSENLAKGLIGGVLGLMIATVGIDNFTGYSRFTFGSIYLMGGISFVPILIGLFAFSQIIFNMLEGDNQAQETKKFQTSFKRTLSHLKEFRKLKWTVLRSGLIGTFIGSVPGTGGDVAAFIAYNETRRSAKKGETFENGNLRGLVSPESANNAVTGGAMVPLLTLGIPGDSVSAIILGAFMIQGLQPGPLLFSEHASDMYMIFAGLLLVNIMMFVLGIFGVRYFTKITTIPKSLLNTLILVLCVIGSYSINNNMIDVIVMIASGFVGYFLIREKFGVAPIILGIILGPMLESNLRRALILSDGDYSVFFSHPISLVLFLLTLVSFTSPLVKRWFLKRKKANTELEIMHE
ncbi:tripartite tricarboxylate transporter permease [Vibrio salinus]|uniref:tripartite tricarboxylate transporter permease n=1 Tax=Vibrio salinus TaxID=2899784 RepID=UPI001E5DC563|nr:tripartite tricarboxylate transporter permease [Vibrio salinus]MCE0495636.1 tripartite tricarboxylate transporter permease [Vibrio salinus]